MIAHCPGSQQASLPFSSSHVYSPWNVPIAQ